MERLRKQDLKAIACLVEGVCLFGTSFVMLCGKAWRSEAETTNDFKDLQVNSKKLGVVVAAVFDPIAGK